MQVRELAHARAGDKGDTSDIGLFADSEEAYNIVEQVLTEQRIQNELQPLINGPVTRYEIPSIRGLNFVIEDALDGGVTTSLRVDAHGKSLSYAVLAIEINIEQY